VTDLKIRWLLLEREFAKFSVLVMIKIHWGLKNLDDKGRSKRIRVFGPFFSNHDDS
jgi:hypothetical protein